MRSWPPRVAATCSIALRQSGQVTHGSPCSGFVARCESEGGWEAEGAGEVTVSYTITLRAPLGQGWIAPPDKCSGSGTDLVTCVFTARSFLITST